MGAFLGRKHQLLGNSLKTEFQYSSQDIVMLWPSAAAAWEVAQRNREILDAPIPLRDVRGPTSII